MTTLGGYSDDCAPLDGCGVSGCYGSYQRTLSNADAHSATYGYTHDYVTSDWFTRNANVSTWSGLTNAINKIKSGYGPQQIDVSYSFIASGSRVKPNTYVDPKTYEVRNYAGTVSGADGAQVGAFIDPNGTGDGFGFSTFTGEVVSAFDEWKGILEDTFRGLTVCFKNLGKELGTGLYNDTEINDTTPFDGFYKSYSMLNGTGYTENVGDIRIGGMKMGRSDDTDYAALAHAYYPNWNGAYRSLEAQSGSVGGDMFFNLSYNWRTGEYAYNSKHWWPATQQQYESTFSIKQVTIHELGHCLGLPHQTNEKGVMMAGVTSLATFDSLYPSGLKHGQANKSYSSSPPGISYSYYRDHSGEVNSYLRNNY